MKKKTLRNSHSIDIFIYRYIQFHDDSFMNISDRRDRNKTENVLLTYLASEKL